ncbi:dihydroxy-acid dehydratase [Desulfococcaceae bacterium HSG7]|nr:dihydroxy-acid dehydratase [Desulfococcaceae bacterium HSG7]
MSIKKRDSKLPDYALVERQEMMIGCGQGDEAINRPQIGVVSSWGEINPASIHLDKVVQMVKAGVWAAGGTPREFVISSICTSMAGHDNYHLPHRDLTAGYIETVAMTNLFDAMVFLPVCDDVIPAHLMAAARLDIPAIAVTGGYMRLNRFKGRRIDPLDVAAKHYQAFKAGDLTEVEFCEVRNKGCSGTGACPVMGTANTMAALAEALGMTLPGNASVPGADSRLQRMAFQAGQQIMHLLLHEIKPGRILTAAAFDNAIRVLMAIGGSTNGVLHLQAIAAELDMEIKPERFNELSRSTPFICDVYPSGSGGHFMADLDEAGGIAGVMKVLQPLLDSEALTVTGHPLKHNLEAADVTDADVIHSLENPLEKEGGLIFLTGNLAPNGALIKQAAVPPSMQQHTGPAVIFTDEESACQALIEDRLHPGSVVVIRYVGPKGDPGMRLLQRFLWQLSAKGLQDRIALITDGRFSGTNKGCAVGHIGPEAAEGGPLAVVADGDQIEIDIANTQINLLISDSDFKKRLAAWTPPTAKVKKGYLAIYSKMAKSADRGAALDYGTTMRHPLK